jgi:ATP-dependent RNA helicase RhlE
MQFATLRLAEPILRSIAAQGYTTATPIQAQAIPHVLEGKDVLGCAQTGTGKTAAFAVPILHRLSTAPAEGNGAASAAPPASGKSPKTVRKARCLVLCPTRELASQIADSFRAYGQGLPLRHTVIFGGVNQNPQVENLRRGVDVIVATPGRLLDLLQQRHVDLRGIETLVLDEADRMLDMGFIHDIRKIIAQMPANRQTLLFSATMVPDIRRLAGSILRNPVTIQVTPVSSTAERIEESVYRVTKQDKPELLAHLVQHLPISRAIVFTRTKHGADRLVRHLHVRGIRAEAIHGNKSQNARKRALDHFSSNKLGILVATDIASRGIDVEGITHVVNYDLTHEPETYVHRIGRTARAGASGAAVSFCDHEEVGNLKAIERLLRRAIAEKPNPLPSAPADRAARAALNKTTESAHPSAPAGQGLRPAKLSRTEQQQPRTPAAARSPQSPRTAVGRPGRGIKRFGGGASRRPASSPHRGPRPQRRSA